MNRSCPPTRRDVGCFLALLTSALALSVACGGGESQEDGPDGAATGGATQTGGTHTGGTGGIAGTGGGAGTGGLMATGGAGGLAATGGAGGLATTGGAGGLAATGGAGGAAVRLEGRIDNSDAARPTFTWSGSAMIARFQGTGATLRLDGSANQFQVVLNGTPTGVVKTTSGTTQYTLASGLTSGVYDLVVWRRTEGSQGKSRFLGLDVTGGALQPPRAPSERRLEIYGDSISAGYGLDGKGPSCPHAQDTDNHYLTYGAVTARALSLDLHTIAWSGIGMYRNYNNTAASPDAMPAVFARTLADDAATPWDFARWQPQAVVINLGTNDVSTHGDPGMPFRTAYLEFVRGLRQRYPSAFFILTIGPMLDGTNLTAVRAHLQAIVQTRSGEGDNKLSYLEFPTQVQADGYGCDSHPSAATNAKMATLLMAELKTRVGWQ